MVLGVNVFVHTSWDKIARVGNYESLEKNEYDLCAQKINHEMLLHWTQPRYK